MFGINKTKKTFYTPRREKVKWKVPALFTNDDVIFLLDDICKELKLAQPVHSVFGAVKSLWGGGRVSPTTDITEAKANSILTEYNSRNISCAFTFSNYYVTKEHFNDKIPNMLLDIANSSGFTNYAIITNDKLGEYIRTKYPNIKLISSIIKPYYDFPQYNETPAYYNDLCKRFDKVVVRTEFYCDYKFMKKLKYKDKIELLVNIGCFKKCEIAKIHYDITSNFESGIDTSHTHRFCNKKMNNIESVYDIGTICNKDIDELVKLGFTNLKLKGRGSTDDILLGTIIGRYIFEPTGYFQFIEKYILDKITLKNAQNK